MKSIKILTLIGWACLTTLSVQAQKKVPHNFQYQAKAPSEGVLKELTQVSYSGTSSIRLYFEQVQLGPDSYLLLEGNDGAQQKLDAVALKNWRNSSAYFNGQNVKVSLYQAQGEEALVKLKEIIVNSQAKESTSFQTTNAEVQARMEKSDDLPPWAAAVGRFTNGVSSFGTGWIAPNGAIVAPEEILHAIFSEEDHAYNIIEFNVPASNPDGSVNHPGPEDQYPVVLNDWDNNSLWANYSFKRKLNLIVENEPGLDLSSYRFRVAILEALPNSTGQRPGERQQQYFRIAANPSSFVLENNNVDIDILHYGSYDADLVNPEKSKTLRKTTTTMLAPSDYLKSVRLVGGGEIDNDDVVLYYSDSEKPFSGSMGAPITYHNSNVAIGVHYTNYVHAPSGAIGFANDFWRDKVDRYFTNNGVYVDSESLYQPGNGDIHKPYHLVANAVSNAADDAILYLAKGSYDESVVINTPMTLTAPVGVVKIGTSEDNNARTAQASLPSILFTENNGDIFNEEDLLIAQSSLKSFPNPFTDRTELHYTLTDVSPVQVKVYNMLGQEVHTLIQEEQPEGKHSVQWDGRNFQGHSMPTGLYIMQLKTGEKTSSVRIMKQ